MKTNRTNNQESHDLQDLRLPDFAPINKSCIAKCQGLLLFDRMTKKGQNLPAIQWDGAFHQDDFFKNSAEYGAYFSNKTELVTFCWNIAGRFCWKLRIPTDKSADVGSFCEEVKQSVPSLVNFMLFLLTTAHSQGSSCITFPFHALKDIVGGRGRLETRIVAFLRLAALLAYGPGQEQWLTQKGCLVTPLMHWEGNLSKQTVTVFIHPHMIQDAYPQLIERKQELNAPHLHMCERYICIINRQKKLSKEELIAWDMRKPQGKQQKRIAPKETKVRYIRVCKGAILQAAKHRLAGFDLYFYYWLTANLTRKGSRSTSFKTEIKEGNQFLSCLGNFKFRPGTGFYLKGISGDTLFLNKHTFKELAKPKDLLRKIVDLVESKFGGLVYGKVKGGDDFIPSHRLKLFGPKELLKLKFFYYLPLEFLKEMKELQVKPDPLLDDTISYKGTELPYGFAIKAYRDDNQLSQSELASILQTTRANLAQWERGRTVPQQWRKTLAPMLQDVA